ncbi:MAG: hypothetical protein KGZ39_00290 [Simkania sp.]|nr:hypothetical protein [Simkania sp.]
MVQIIEGTSPFSSIAKGLGGGLASGFLQGQQKKHELALIDAKEAAKQKNRIALALATGLISEDVAARLTGVSTQESKGKSDLSKEIPETSRQDFSNQILNPRQKEEPTTEQSEQEETALELIYPGLGKQKTEQRKLRRKEFESDRAYNSARSDKYLDELGKSTSGIREREIGIDSSIAAVNSGQLSPLGGSFWADILNIPSLRDQSGATLQAAAKVNLIGALDKVGARPNQFIEKQISSAFAQVGETKESQMAKLNIAKTVLDLDKKELEIAQILSDQYRKDLGYVPANIDSLVRTQMKPYTEKRMEKLAYDLQESREMSQNPEFYNTLQKVYPGTPLTEGKYKVFYHKAKGNTEEERDAKALEMAKKAGYKIVDPSILGIE